MNIAALPLKFQRNLRIYKGRFVYLYRLGRYHLKKTYSGGWHQPTSRRGRPLALYRDEKTGRDWLEEAVLGHLDGEHWLALYSKEHASHEAVDVDAHEYRLASYWDGPYKSCSRELPLVCPTLDYFRVLKKLFDGLDSERWVWSISSESLGFHIHRPLSRIFLVERLHANLAARLESLGLGHLEGYPHPTRPFRRPFGRDSATVTPTGLLFDWQDQLEYFENERRSTPSFQQIVNQLRGRVTAQHTAWIFAEHKTGDRNLTQLVSRRLEEVENWCRAGFPVEESRTSRPETRPETRLDQRPDQPSPVRSFDLDDARHGRWAFQCREWARDGLPSPDTFTVVVHELAKWLVWVELYDEPRRVEQVTELLKRWAREKHNGQCTRANLGNWKRVDDDIRHAVNCALRLDRGQRAESLELFCRIRLRRAAGQYRDMIACKPYLEQGEQGADQAGQEINPSSTYSVSCLTVVKPLPLPPEFVELIEANRGRCQVAGFASRLLAVLPRSGHSVGLSRARLSEVLGYKNPSQVDRYVAILVSSGLIRKGHYLRGKRSCQFALTKKSQALLARESQSKTG